MTSRSVLIAMGGGAIIFFASYLPFTGLLSVIGVSLFLVAARREGASARGVFWSGVFGGSVLMVGATSWLFRSIPFVTEQYHYPSVAVAGLVIFAVMSILVPTAPLFGLWALLVRRIGTSFFWDILLTPLIWVAMEYVRMLLLSWMSASSVVVNEPYFSYGMIGYPLADYDGLLQFARFGGVYTLSFMAAAGGVSLYWIVRKWRDGQSYFLQGFAVIGCLLLCAVLPLSFAREYLLSGGAHRDLHVAVVTEYLGPPFLFPRTADLSHAVMSGALLILPEGSRALPPFVDWKSRSKDIAQALGDSSGAMIDSGGIPNGKGEKIATASFSLASSTILVREKQVLTPYGEYIPWVLRALATTFGFENILYTFAADKQYVQGAANRPLLFDGVWSDVVFCSEIVKPHFVARLVLQKKVGFIALVSSTNWFPNARYLHRETVRMIRIQAVEAGVPIARSSLGDPAIVVDRYGRILFEGEWGKASVALVVIPV